MRTKFLDQSQDAIGRDAFLDAVDEIGLTPEEAIPGLIQAILHLARLAGRSEQDLLDEASDLLADGVI